ncbi:SpoIID/LytB domain-containing protein [Symbiobacterium thermophilum]
MAPLRARFTLATALLTALLLVLVTPVPGAWSRIALAETGDEAVPAPPADFPVRVGLAWGQTAAEIGSTGGLWIVADGGVLGEVPAGASVRAVLTGGGLFVEPLQSWFAGPVRLVPFPGGYISFQGRAYRGEIQLVVTAKGQLSVVNVVNLEDYLLSVVPAEMDHRWPEEALKAQAVASRSYAVANLGRWAEDGFDLRATVDDQAYLGIAQEKPGATAAVLATAGEVITYQGRVVAAYYHSSSGGHTENNEDIWTGGSPQGYLRGVPDYDALPENRYTAWSSTFTVDEFSQRLEAAGFGVGRVTAVTPGRPAASGRPATWEVVGTEGSRTLTMQQMRSALGLPAPPRQIALAGAEGPVSVADPDADPAVEPEPAPAPAPATEPEPQPAPDLAPEQGPKAAPVAVLGADGLVRARPVVGSYALGAGGVAQPLEGLAAVASAHGYVVVGAVPRPGATVPSRGDARPREPEQGGAPTPAPAPQPEPQSEPLPEPRPAPKAEPEAIVVSGSGHGHGVGMSQWGAHGMALLGKSYIEILTHYYTGTKVETR